MKTPNIFMFFIVAVLLVVGCDDEWASHYAQRDVVIENDEIEITDMPIETYLKSSGYTRMSQMFEETAVYDAMESQDLLYTVFVVANDGITPPDDAGQKDFLAKAHVTTASISPSNMKDGQRVVMWNRKYVNVTKESEDGDLNLIALNGSRVKKVIQAENGYIYELEAVLNTPLSLLETLEGLDDENYSIFKEMVLSKNITEFDREASLPIGVDGTGNTIYDSVFTVINPYFLNQGLDLASESAAFTMLIPSNQLIEDALADAKRQLDDWGLTRQDSVLENWCFQTAFFNERLERERFEDTENIDLFSAFGKQWRTTVNKVDLDNPVELSNGIAYYMTKLKIPQNVLIYRLKDFFNWYPNLTAEDKEKYYVLTNLVWERNSQNVAPWTPGYGWPVVSNVSSQFIQIDPELDYGILDFTAFNLTLHDDNSYDLRTYVLPPGEYTLHLGFHSNTMGSALDVSFNGELVRSLTRLEYEGYSRDRQAGGYPEFFPPSLSGTYDRDGREVDTIRVTGTEPVPIRIQLHTYKYETGERLAPQHWAIRPTANCY